MQVRSGRSFFESPQLTTYLLMTINIVIFGLCLRNSAAGSGAISPEILWRNGAMHAGALANHEYWRLVAAGFLHWNMLHLATNMLCLALWGGHLERRVGPTYFLMLYLVAVIGGNLTGTFSHSGPYLSAGASGAISGILGALLCLRLLRKIDLPASFFAINIGLNIALSTAASNIDWGAHLGGFVAGLLGCAVLDVLERLNGFWLRCKFPEFIKLNVFAVATILAVLVWVGSATTLTSQPVWLLPLLYVVACAVAIKAIDIMLSLKKGLAILVALLAVANAALIWLAGSVFGPIIASACQARRIAFPFDGTVIGTACAHVNLTIAIMEIVACALTLLLYSQELYRGIKDVGFVGSALQGERRRRQGL